MSPIDPFASACGALGDWIIGEPPDRLHPVAWFGTTMAAFEQRIYAPTKVRGVVHALVGIGGATAIGWTLQRLVRPLGHPGRWLSTATASEVSIAGAMLCDVARQIGAALEHGQLEQARLLLPSLVGRRPDDLSEAEIARAVIESLAENTVDAVVAPALWATTFGAPAALGYRAANTLDAMVGHHNERYERYGWASAHLDDIANWIAARLTVALMAAVRPTQAGAIINTARRDGPQHPSPNGGWVEAAMAAALNVQLGGTNRYGADVEHRALLGSGRLPAGGDIARAITLVRHTTIGLSCLLSAISLADVVTGRTAAAPLDRSERRARLPERRLPERRVPGPRLKVFSNRSHVTRASRLLDGRPSDRRSAK
jgi:adenosylcobinamide-phosphate synthase